MLVSKKTTRGQLIGILYSVTLLFDFGAFRAKAHLLLKKNTAYASSKPKSRPERENNKKRPPPDISFGNSLKSLFEIRKCKGTPFFCVLKGEQQTLIRKNGQNESFNPEEATKRHNP
jgi:hypothetical protein